jgi:hypothetical protein
MTRLSSIANDARGANGSIGVGLIGTGYMGKCRALRPVFQDMPRAR